MHHPGGIVYHGRYSMLFHLIDSWGISARAVRAAIYRHQYKADLEAAVRRGSAMRFDRLGITQEEVERCARDYGWPTDAAGDEREERVKAWMRAMGVRG